MPIYEFRCRTCDSRFEELRPVGASSTGAVCPEGHADTERLLSLIAPATGPGASAAGAAVPSGGGGACCASGCACGAN